MTHYTPAERDAAWAQLCPTFDLRAAIAQIIDVQCELNRVRAELAVYGRALKDTCESNDDDIEFWLASARDDIANETQGPQ